MVGNQNWKIILVISIVVLSLIHLLDSYISDTEKLLYERLQSNVINDMSHVGENMNILLQEKTLDKKDKSFFEYFKDRAEVRQYFEKQLNLFISSKIRYIYLIYKDEEGRFRFLLDGSAEDKARFNQKLDVESSEYEDIYTSKKELAITQKSLEKLSITFLYPILNGSEVEAILVVDFSSAFEYELRKIIAPLKTMFTLMYLLIGIFLIITFIQTLFYYQARKRSYLDELTGCYNRQYLRYFLDINDIAEYQILMIDCDHFKKINDNYGHEIGDKVLVFITDLIKCCLINKDKGFRYGGEEFLVLVHRDNDADLVAESIRKKIEDAYLVNKQVSINITVSIGVNTIPTHARNTSQAINITDAMLYKAKVQGRNRIVSYASGMSIDIDEKHSTADNIYHVVEALSNDKVVCHFHKIIDKENKIYKYEALVRYINSDGEVVYPNHFLYDIMHTNVYTDVTKRVIDICIETMKSQKVSVSLNLNVNDLLNDVLVKYLVQRVEEIKELGIYLTVEILENEEIKNMDDLKIAMKTLHAQGVRFALDDFGSGYANYSYLIELDIDYIKIDGSLVQSALEFSKSKSIVKSIIELAHEMGVKTIVEFVSSKEIYEMMVSLETDYLQGFYISKPDAKI